MERLLNDICMQHINKNKKTFLTFFFFNPRHCFKDTARMWTQLRNAGCQQPLLTLAPAGLWGKQIQFLFSFCSHLHIANSHCELQACCLAESKRQNARTPERPLLMAGDRLPSSRNSVSLSPERSAVWCSLNPSVCSDACPRSQRAVPVRVAAVPEAATCLGIWRATSYQYN